MRRKGEAPLSLEKELNDNFSLYNILGVNDNLDKKVLNHMVVKDYLKVLTTKQRQIICLYYFSSYSSTEIAKLIGCTHQCVNKIKKQAIQKMRQAEQWSKFIFKFKNSIAIGGVENEI